MGFMDELKKLAKPYTEDEDDFDEFDDDVRPTRASRSSSAPAPSRAPSFDLDDTDDDISSSLGSSSTAARRTPGNNKVVNIHTTAQMQVSWSSQTGSTTFPTSPSTCAANTRWF